MYQGIQSNERLQPCPDCGITICSCQNCHTMHCDSEALCTYLKSFNKITNQKFGDPIISSSTLDHYSNNISVYTSKVDKECGLKAITSISENAA